MRTLNGIEDILSSAGEHLGTSPWFVVTQDLIDRFADLTDDHQWIHVDPARAAEESPYKSTVAHGLLTLSLHPALGHDNFRVAGARMGVNYGYNKIRFLEPVRPGSSIRLSTTLAAATEVAPGTVQMTLAHSVELRGNDRPALVAEVVTRYLF